MFDTESKTFDEQEVLTILYPPYLEVKDPVGDSISLLEADHDVYSAYSYESGYA